jgi:asparagine synthase (glutamine-hydrolysing)
MCGIAGYYGEGGPTDAQVEECLGLMIRRGPDARAVYRHRHASGRAVCLLHSRLKIIDLDDRANQPYRLGDKVLCFNGEIYNYLELRRELAGRGIGFTTQSDTEVLAQALTVLGDGALDRCEGMWAFAHYDESHGRLWLSRDRFGEKPLYLLRAERGWYFGSEVKFIRALCGRALEVNRDQILRYLVNGYKSLYKGGQTFFRGLGEVPAGTIQELGASSAPRRYWQPSFEADERVGYDEAVRRARELMIDAVKLRLRADVPLAFCLSGGVDSNALVAIARRVCGYDVHGFTIVNTDRRYDERTIVEATVAELGIKHTEIPVETQDFLPLLRTLVRQHDAPVYTINYFAQWRLMERIAAHGYKISLSGTGADELFTGYYDHHLAYLREVRADAELYGKSLAAWVEHIKPIVRNPFLGDPELFIRRPEFRDHIYLHADEFATYLQRPWREPFTESRYSPSLLRNRMLNEVFHEAVPVILHEDDLNAMYYSIENRTPYLDRRLFELCFSVPARHLIRGGFGKAILREAMRGIVPNAVLDNHRKVGFNAPIRAYLDTRDPAVREKLLGDSPIFDVVRRDRIAMLLDKPEISESESKFLFSFVSSQIFLEEFGR